MSNEMIRVRGARTDRRPSGASAKGGRKASASTETSGAPLQGCSATIEVAEAGATPGGGAEINIG